VEEINIKSSTNKEKEEKGQKAKETEMEIEEIKEEDEKDINEESKEDKKLSLYKIKKNRIIREFIAVLRELDT